MLNEVIEYEQYTMDFEVSKKIEDCRLKYFRLIKKDFAGIERALTIVARGYIFDHKRPFSEYYTKEALKAWCGFEYDTETPDIENLKNWLPQYIKHMMCLYIEECLSKLNGKGGNKKFIPLEMTLKNFTTCNLTCDMDKEIEVLKQSENTIKDYPDLKKDKVNVKLVQIRECYEALKALDKKSEIWSRDIYSFSQGNSNSIKGISFESIIADALLKGKLERYYLMSDINPFMSGMIEKPKGERYKMLPAEPRLEKDKNEKDRILKITAVYLLQKLGLEQEYVFFNKTDTSNWLTELKQELDSKELQCYKLSRIHEDVFLFNTIGNNIIKLRLHPEWRKHFKIIKSSEIDKPENKGLIFYGDFGSSQFLQEGKCY